MGKKPLNRLIVAGKEEFEEISMLINSMEPEFESSMELSNSGSIEFISIEISSNSSLPATINLLRGFFPILQPPKITLPTITIDKNDAEPKKRIALEQFFF